MKKILITGSEGFIGKKLISFYIKKKFKVYGSYYKREITKIKKAQYIKCNFINKNEVYSLLDKTKPDYIFHLAAKSHPTFSFKNPDLTIKTNLNGTFYLFDSLKKLNINPKIIIAGSSAQFGSKKKNDLPINEKSIANPDHIYGFTKQVQVKLAEIYHKMYSFDVCSALIFNTSGNGKNFDVFQDFCNQLKRNKNKKNFSLMVGNIENQRDFLHVDDVVNALDTIKIKGRPGKSYIISSNKLTKIKKIIEIMKKISKNNFSLKIDKKLYRKFDEKIILGNNREIKKLGWKPKKNIYHILNDIINEK